MQTYKETFTYKSLYKAHLKGRLSKRDKKPLVNYELTLISNIYDLFLRMQNKTYKMSPYHRFIVYEPKKRQIQTLKYEDRIVQHVLCDDVLMPYFSKRAIMDNCVCQVGKGMHFANDRLRQALIKMIRKHGKKLWGLKCDIKKYFPSMPHSKLIEVFCTHIKDPDLKNLLIQIIDSFHTEFAYLERYNIPPNGIIKSERGIPIGNQTSQVFGMFYLNSLDRLIKEKLRIKVYSRYMDDFLLFSESKQELENAYIEITKHVESLGLKLNSKTHIFSLKNSFTYLGFKYTLNKTNKLIRTICKKTARRMHWRVKYLKKLYKEKLYDKERIKLSLVAFHGHLCHGKCWRLENNLKNSLKDILDEPKIENSKQLTKTAYV